MPDKAHSREAWFDWARDSLRNIDKAKSDIIQELAKALEEWIPIEMISEEISRELADSGYISSSYIRLVLPEKYKNKRKQTSTSISGNTILVKGDSTNANDVNNYGEKIFMPKAVQDYKGSIESQFKSITRSEKEENLKERLDAAEMEVNFIKEQLGDGKIIALKGNKCDEVGQFYWGRISVKQLGQKLLQMEKSGINLIEIYMHALPLEK